MANIRICFVDFWNGFNPVYNFFTLLLTKYTSNTYIIDYENPEIVIHSIFGTQHNKYRNCKKILFHGERYAINPFDSDLSLTSHSIETYKSTGRHFRLPLWILFINWFDADVKLLSDPDPIDKNIFYNPSSILPKTKFCAFIVTNGTCEIRNKLFYDLSKYKKVDSAGKFENNIGYVLPNTYHDKINFLKDYKFCIAYENHDKGATKGVLGYITEKLVHAKISCIPIYFGSPDVSEEFNEKSFINSDNYKTNEELIQRIIELDTNDEKYYAMLNEPLFRNDKWMKDGKFNMDPYFQELTNKILDKKPTLNVDKVYVINHPSLTERRQFMEQQLKAYRIDFSFVGQDYDDETYNKYYSEDPIKREQRSKILEWNDWRTFRKTEKNLALNHILKCYQDALDNNYEKIIVFEDDALILCGNSFIEKMNDILKTLPADFDILYFGSGCGLHVPEKIESDKYIYERFDKKSRCTDSMLLSKKGIEKIMANIVPFCLPIDWELTYISRLCDLKIYWLEVDPPLIVQGSQARISGSNETLFKSAIQLENI
jgi:GR25 family glycosyltransferase involved in LPS biosynthesis